MSGKHKHTRRTFLGNATQGCASLGFTSLLSGWTNMSLANAAAAANRPIYSSSPYRALVCILLSGGNDSFNMLIPRGTNEYNDYATVRTNLAIDQNQLRTINPLNPDGKQYGLHPNLSKVQNLFETEKLSFLANIGTLIQPTTMLQYKQSQNLPLGLYSHIDQRQHWQTSVPHDRNSNGWGGRLADILHTNNQNTDVSMNISLNGINIFQRGDSIQSYSINPTDNGSVLINGAMNNSIYEQLKRETVDSLLEYNYQFLLEKAYANAVQGAKNNSIAFDAAIAAGDPISVQFGNGQLSQRLKMVARTIAARNILNVSNQTFFVELGGFDNHDDILVNHATLMAELDTALHDFNEALEELQVENDVTTFTISDFARKLVSNGDGSDHAWGGHALVMGGAVQGKHIFGQYPELFLGNALDTGDGRLLPTTSCDEYFAELALWFGASSSDLDRILPNINNFWTPVANGHPIGFLHY